MIQKGRNDVQLLGGWRFIRTTPDEGNTYAMEGSASTDSEKGASSGSQLTV